MVSYGKDPGRIVQQVVQSVGSKSAGEVKIGQWWAGEKYCKPVVTYRH